MESDFFARYCTSRQLSGKAKTAKTITKVDNSHIYIIKKKLCLFVCLSTFSIFQYLSKSIIVTKKIIVEIG